MQKFYIWYNDYLSDEIQSSTYQFMTQLSHNFPYFSPLLQSWLYCFGTFQILIHVWFTTSKTELDIYQNKLFLQHNNV